MRKNSVRKFIHAILDLLPLFVIPIFAININQKSVEPVQVEVQENLEVDFNQYRPNLYSDGSFNNTGKYVKYLSTSIPLVNQHIYYTSMYISCSVANQNVWFRLGHSGNPDYLFNMNPVPTGETFLTYRAKLNLTGGNECYFMSANANQYTITFRDLMVIDLTQMYGEGNEPSVAEFREHYTDSYYDYTISKKELIPNGVTTTYNDTDIGSQFLYSLYIPVNDYFNFNNLFNMGSIYDWIQLNLFSGTAPLPVFIIWNIIVYEFFVDLLFLFYGVFMFIIDFAEKCLERPFGR